MPRYQNLRIPFVKEWLKQRRSPYLYILIVAVVITVFSLPALFLGLENVRSLPFPAFSALALPAFLTLFLIKREKQGKIMPRTSPGLQVMIRQQMLAARDWDNFVDTLLQFPKAVIPLAGASLTLCDPIIGSCETVKEWNPTGSRLPKFLNFSEICALTFIVQPQPLGFFVSPESITSEGEGPALNCFCLPFLFASRQIGFLMLYLPQKTHLSSDQINVLNGLIPEIGFLLEFAYLKRSLSQYTELLEKEQKRIARYLHDTVAQNLAVLRFRLDRLIAQDADLNLPDLHSQLGQIHAIAGRADDELRESIADLRREPAIELESALLEFAQEIGQSAGFTLEVSSEGETQNLPAHLQRQIFLILREAIRNIEKHAQASRVAIHSTWQKDCLQLRIEDNGRGFAVEQGLHLKGHYGLKIMVESAKEINAQVTFMSSVGSGTIVTLAVPVVVPLKEFEKIQMHFAQAA
jgi:signal transduction histidine kinase